MTALGVLILAAILYILTWHFEKLGLKPETFRAIVIIFIILIVLALLSAIVPLGEWPVWRRG